MNYQIITNKNEQSLDDISTFHTKKKDIHISVIIPTYNERELIEGLINSISEVLQNKCFEIIIVDDNSPDKTADVVRSFILSHKEEITLLIRNKRGVFSAQQDGIKIAAGKYIVLMDADFSHPPDKILEMYEYIENNDLVSCSRFLPNSKIIAPFTRKYSTVILNLALRVFMRYNLTDYTSIFLMADRKKWEKLQFYYDSIWGEAGIEIFHQARLNNLKIKEIPFTYNFREEGTSKSDNLLKYAFVYLKRAIDIKFFYRGRK